MSRNTSTLPITTPIDIKPMVNATATRSPRVTGVWLLMRLLSQFHIPAGYTT